MNELIQQLAQSADAIPIHGKPKDRALVGLETIQNFARLVVQECIQVLDDMPLYGSESSRQIQEDTLLDAVRTIEEHFKL